MRTCVASAICMLLASGALADPPGEISRWKGDGNALDSVGPNNGTLNNVTFFSEAQGQSFSFGPTAGSVSFPNPAAGGLALTSGVTITAWVRQTSESLGGSIFNVRPATNVAGYAFEQDGLAPATALQMGVNVLGGSGVDSFYLLRTPLGAIPVGELRFVAATYDQATARIAIYVGGELVAEQVFDTPRPILTSPSSIAAIGRNNVVPEFFWRGQIDDVRVFGRALNGCEIREAGGLPPCDADRDCDGRVDLTDFFAFFNCWDLSSPCADVDGSTEVDLGDFFAFFNAFDVGC
jgi:hypothetical protein